MIVARVQPGVIDIGADIIALTRDGAGAIATFSGVVRADDGVDALELEHYPTMTEAVMHDLATAAARRWSLIGVHVIHRVGRMLPGDIVVLVAATAPHRHPALEACGFLIDALKTQAPFWKREWRGSEGRWVAARLGDDDALKRWHDKGGEE